MRLGKLEEKRELFEAYKSKVILNSYFGMEKIVTELNSLTEEYSLRGEKIEQEMCIWAPLHSHFPRWWPYLWGGGAFLHAFCSP